MHGRRHEVAGADGTRIGLLTSGSGPPLLLVHGGMTQLERWAPLWDLLAVRFTVTAMDRRGRGSSGDGERYDIGQEYEDVRAVVAQLAEAAGGPVDVFGHSYGATVTLGAASTGARVRRLVLHEPPGPATVPREWVERATAQVRAGRPGHAMASFLVEVVGLSPVEVEALRGGTVAYDVLDIVSATMPREALALTRVDLAALAKDLAVPVLLLLGEVSPPWAGLLTRRLADALPNAEVRELPGLGHEAPDTAPETVRRELERYLLP